MNCPSCGATPDRWHGAGCSWEQCPRCGYDLFRCDHDPPRNDRLAWSGYSFWLESCVSVGFFKKRVRGEWVACGADEPGCLPDVERLLRERIWNRREQRFEPRQPEEDGCGRERD